MSFNHFSETKLALLPNELQDYIYDFIMKDNITSLLKEMMHQLHYIKDDNENKYSEKLTKVVSYGVSILPNSYKFWIYDMYSVEPNMRSTFNWFDVVDVKYLRIAHLIDDLSYVYNNSCNVKSSWYNSKMFNILNELSYIDLISFHKFIKKSLNVKQPLSLF